MLFCSFVQLISLCKYGRKPGKAGADKVIQLIDKCLIK